MKKLILLLISIFITVTSVQAQDIVECNISNTQIILSTGSKELKSISGDFSQDPFDFINRELEQLKRDNEINPTRIEIYFSNEEFFFTKAARLEKTPETLMIIHGEETTFRGDRVFSGKWEKRDNYYEMQLTQEEASAAKGITIFSDRKMCLVAGTKDSGLLNLIRTTEFIKNQGETSQPSKSVKYFKLPQKAKSILKNLSNYELQNVYLHFYHKWDNTRYKIEKYNKILNIAKHRGKGMKPWNKLDSETTFYISNIRSGMDSPGEWFITKDSKLLYIPFANQKMNEAKISYPVTDKFFLGGEEFSNTKFSGITFSNSALFTGDTMEFLPAQSANQIDAALTFDNASNLIIENCNFSNIGKYAIWLRTNCSKSEIKNNIIENVGCGGIRLGETTGVSQLKGKIPSENLITNNIIRHGGRLIECSAGILSGHAANNEISRNEIYDFFYTGISIGWVWGYNESPSKGNRIINNHIHKIGQGILSDMAGIYTLGKSEGTVVSGNVIHNIRADHYGGWGLYTDEGSSNILIEKNLVFDTDTGAFHQHYGRENIIRNNIFGMGLKYQIQATRIEDHLSFTFSNNIVIKSGGVLFKGPFSQMNIQMENNCYFFADGSKPDFTGKTFEQWKATGLDKNSIIADPGFIDLQNLNFSIKNRTLTERISFQEFDYTKAGVTGKMQTNINNQESNFLYKKRLN
ncbi:MAG: right-handed parallel beta-helix repeat-containing protein [Spirochaetales bacterium]|nr:right-handed parallel beta-helix repeat-containing protein [Spirochaetales bacterium]